jgi:hypothetical protein
MFLFCSAAAFITALKIIHCYHHRQRAPAGKKILTGLNCKEMILSYLMSDNDTIKREAIVCVSEMLTASM